MVTGILLLVSAGVCAAAIGTIISHAARNRLDLTCIQGGAALLCSVAAGGSLLMRHRSMAWSDSLIPVLAAVWAAGFLNYFMLKLMNRGMRSGNNAVVWGVTQSALVVPFSMGILCFGVVLSAARGVGLLLILAAIACFARARPPRAGTGRPWLLPTAGAFVCAGISQSFSNLPSYLVLPGIDIGMRTFLAQFGTFCAFLANAACSGGGRTGVERTLLKPMLLLGAINLLVSFAFLYRGLNLLAAAGAGSIGYPVVMGACIGGFFLYSRFVLRERLGAAEHAGFAAVIAGIIVISC